MVMRSTELRDHVGKRVTLVGTAGENDAGDATLALRDGDVILPAYGWPENFVGQSVMVLGTVAKPQAAGGHYRLGDVELAERWSR
jgi:hypothetical protein